MSIYKKVTNANGRTTIFKDGKAIKPKDIDQVPVIVMSLENGNTIEIGEEDLKPNPKQETKSETKPETKLTDDELFPERISVFSGLPATRRRWLNGREYWMTDEERSYTLGELAQAVREKREKGLDS